MTRKEAAEKVAKLRKLANGSSNPHESESAWTQAAKLIEEHHLTDHDLSSGSMAAAFDDLVDGLQKYMANLPAMPEGLLGSGGTLAIVTDVIHRIKTIDDSEKATRLRQFTTLVRTISFITGNNNPTLSSIKSILDTALRNHGVAI